MAPRRVLPRWTWLDRLLVVLACAYFVVVASSSLGTSVHSSAEDIADGRVWPLLTSALEVNGGLPLPQAVLTASVAAFVIVREGPRLWWAAALGAHVASALIAYAAIGVAVGLGSDSARRAADDPDYGVSCVLAGSVGALFVSGLLGPHARSAGGASRPSDRLAVAMGTLGFLALLTVAFGWYDMEHPIAFVVGASVTWLWRRWEGRANPQHRYSSSV